MGDDPDGYFLPCDFVLILGQCIMDESNLTGESIPVSKVPIASYNQTEFNPDEEIQRKHALFSGSKML